jgi:GxxExxY protein
VDDASLEYSSPEPGEISVARQGNRRERDPRTFALIGAAMEVHRQLGCGFAEPVYQEALDIELTARGIPFSREVELPVHYKGRTLRTAYRADYVAYGCVVVELKALAGIGGIEEAQVLNYLKATGFQLGLLLNVGAKSLQYKRVVLSLPQRQPIVVVSP